MQPDATFQTISAVFAELGADRPEEISRTLLLRDGYFLGHRFRCDKLQAVLLPDSEEVEFFDEDGELLQSVRVQRPAEMRKAA